MKTHRSSTSITRHSLLAAFALAATGFFISTTPLGAQTITSAVPGTISYQGRVLNSSGQPVGAGTPVSRTVVFRVWDSPSNTAAANLLYSESQTVSIAEGEFSVLAGLGAVNTVQTFGYAETLKGPGTVVFSSVFNGTTRYLGVTVAAGTVLATTDNEITPRQQIVSSAFAFRSKFAESLGTNGATALTALDSGNVGIGNVNPPALFTITGLNSSTATNTPQLILTDSVDTNERLVFGMDNTGNGTGFIQATKVGTAPQTLLLNPNGGTIGIGTPTPNTASRLHIFEPTGAADTPNSGTILLEHGNAGGASSIVFRSKNNAASDYGYIRYQDDVNNAGGLAESARLVLGTSNDGDDHLILQPSGNVGIGMMNPARTLNVGGSGIAIGDIVTTNATSLALSVSAASGGYSRIQSLKSQNVDYGDIMLNEFGGNVAIGRSDTAAKLDVYGQMRLDNSTTGNPANGFMGGTGTRLVLWPGNASGTPFAMGIASSTMWSGVPTGAQHQWFTGTSSAMTLNGDLNITSGGVNATGGGIHGRSDGFSWSARRADGTLLSHVQNGTNGFTLVVDLGDVLKPGGGPWAALSDGRLKKNVVSLTGSLEKLLKLRSVNFEFKDPAAVNETAGVHTGFIAQEVAPVFPNWVKDTGEHKVIAIKGFEALTVQALRELRAEKDSQIKERDEKIAALEAKLSALEGSMEKRLAALEKSTGTKTASLPGAEATPKAVSRSRKAGVLAGAAR